MGQWFRAPLVCYERDTMDDADFDDSDTGDLTVAPVFVSYSRGDQKQALAIIRMLESAGFRVWWDGLLEGGVRYDRATENALDHAKAVVVVWSKTSVDSHWVHDEAARGRDSGRLVPVSLDGVSPPLGFGQFQCIDVSHDLGRPGSPAMQKIVQAVAALAGATHRPEAALPSGRRLLGRRSVVIGGTALALSGGWLALSKGGFLSPTLERSIAVLPFANLSGDPGQRYFSDGLTAEIRSQLSRNALLQIVGSTSSEEFRDFSGDARTIAQKLDVAFLLGGNVQRAADKVKVAVDLTDGKSGLSKWAETFERPMANIFALQSEIATRVVSQLAVAIDDRGSTTATGGAGGTDSVAAFDAYLRGRDLYEAGLDETSDRQALAKFDEAIAFDPKYAGAHAARSRSLAVIGNLYAEHEERVRLYNDALLSAKRATGLAARFAEGFSALGFALASGQVNMRSARAPFAKSYELGKGDADILSRYATFLSHLRDHATADRLIRDALTLDPINPRVYRSLGDISLSGRQYDKAIAAYRKAGSLNLTLGGLNNSIGSAQYLLGRLDEAYASFSREKSSVRRLPGLAMIDGRRGNRAKAEAALAALVAEYGEKSNYQYAQIYAQWGETAKALKALETAKDLRDGGIMLMYADPLLDPIRETAGYASLVRTIGFQ